MKVVSTGNLYTIYDNNLKTYDKLPAQAYQVNFNPRSGYSLSLFDNIEIKEKIYGVHIKKVEKVLKSFKSFDRNLGVILSGDKGIGKSLFAKILSKKAIEEDYPLIIVNSYSPGIADYLTSIQQEVVVLFDEFDKNFYTGSDEKNNSMNDPQSEMLTLFDGLSQGKKLFVVTCNSLRNLNDYLVNRPGRFHYHFRFEYPNAEEIRAYLEDKIQATAYKEIEKVVSFSQKVKINYDCLRAIAFELLSGDSFEEVIQDLNILNLCEERYYASVIFSDGMRYKLRGGEDIFLDMFSDAEERAWFYDEEFEGHLVVRFNPSDNCYNAKAGGIIIQGDQCTLDFDENEFSDKELAKIRAREKNRKIDYIIFKRKLDRNIHYAI